MFQVIQNGSVWAVLLWLLLSFTSVIASESQSWLFTEGMKSAEKGDFVSAIDRFRLMLVEEPSLLRPRLELARVLFEAKEYDSARYHFEQVLAHDLPVEVRRRVMGYLVQIREELPTYSMTVEMVTDTNPRQVTEKEEVTIGGLSYRLNEDARAKSATGVRLHADGRIPFPGDPLWFVHLTGEMQEYGGEQLDFQMLQATAGRHLRLDRGESVTLEIGRHQARYQKRPLYQGMVWSISDFRPLHSDLSLQLNLTGLELEYPEYSYRNGWQHTVQARLLYTDSPVSRWEVGGGYVHSRAKENPYSFQQPQLNIRYVQEWSGGWITGVTGAIHRTRYQGADPILQKVRRESERRVEFDLLNRRIRLWKMSPKLHLGWIDHKANTDFYAWDRGFVRLGLSGEF